MLNFDRWLTGYTLFGFLLVLLLSLLFFKTKFNEKSSTPQVGWVWGVAFFVILLFMRYPFIAYNKEMDIDESQMLAQALSLKNYWIYWTYVDGLTQGPLASYCLIIPSWLGMPFDYTSARLLGYVFLCITLFATFRTFANLFNWQAALLTFTPIAFFYLLSQGAFTTLYNEYVCLCLLALCFWLFSILYRQQTPDPVTLFLLGFLAGAVPFAKLQGVPTALLTVFFAGILVLMRSTRKWKAMAVLMIGGLLFPLIVAILAIRFNAIEYLWKFYILGNSRYSSGGSILEKALNYLNFLKMSGQFSCLAAGYLLLILFAGYNGLTRFLKLGKSGRPNLLFIFGLLQTLIAFYAVIKSGYTFPHYQQYIIIPLGLLTGVLLETALLNSQWSAQRVRLLSMTLLVMLFLPHLIAKLASIGGYTSKISAQINHSDLGKPLEISQVSKEITRYTQPGDAITIWGWHPAYHLETGLPQGTGDVISYRILTAAPDQKIYQNKYLSDLESRRPVVLVDQVTAHSFWFNNTISYGHEHTPKISHFIEQNYKHVATVNDERIYVRTDRLKASIAHHE
ncbi:hypothetical protein [Dyadobacter arcticus]|uniref:Glycosyltransferase RgtA/B/C/D-like domain-containing protein n=1 Tax=Dyadobacter arcticus TaxID=1078754 RepID=A0ABX0UMR3_9BACT|nr:hypothetical protein [Dyadobacter arcticus]NIJ52920.1 hypothetical protein [Dyadobacter arcticus]